MNVFPKVINPNIGLNVYISKAQGPAIAKYLLNFSYTIKNVYLLINNQTYHIRGKNLILLCFC
jgi:hypothetical protein